MADPQKRPRDDGGYGTPEAKRQAPDRAGAETVFRLLVPARKVGSVIGKGGQIVKTIREETNSKVRVVEGVPNCEDRVIVISSRDTDPAIETNSAQTALLKVHERAIEGEEPPTGGHSPSLMARLLVCHTQAGSIIGKAGKIIKDIRDASGAQIKILPETDLPLCALSNDRVVQVIGDPAAIERALLLVSKQIRENPPKERPGGAPACLMTMLAGGAPAGQSYQGHAVAAGGPQYRPQYR